jgi:hypothetical protein
LFDLENDPEERKNLWDSAEHAGVKREMHDVMRDWYIESSYSTRNRMAEFR